jgi:hypothetical protein
VAPPLIDVLRPKPFRGDVVAAGVLALVTLVWTVEVRFADAWAPGAHLAYAALAWAFVTAMAALAPMEGDTPRAYQSVLYVTGVALLGAVLLNLSELVGSGAAVSSDGNAFWVFSLLALHALAFATLRNSAVCTLVGAIAGGAAVLSFVQWAFDASKASTSRWVLLGLFLIYGFVAMAQRDRRLRHGVALIDAAGFAMLAIAASFLVDMAVVTFGDEPPSVPGAGWGWELLIGGAGFGLVAYSSVDRQPGPAYLGVANLVAFALITSGDVSAAGATLLGWPVALALAAAALLVVGLRPTTPAPPPPDIDAPEPPPLPLR